MNFGRRKTQTEDIDDVGLDWQVGERGVGFFVEDFGDRWVDGVELVAVLLHVGRDVVAGLRGIFGETYDRDGARIFCRGGAQHFANDLGFVHFIWAMRLRGGGLRGVRRGGRRCDRR